MNQLDHFMKLLFSPLDSYPPLVQSGKLSGIEREIRIERREIGIERQKKELAPIIQVLEASSKAEMSCLKWTIYDQVALSSVCMLFHRIFQQDAVFQEKAKWMKELYTSLFQCINNSQSEALLHTPPPSDEKITRIKGVDITGLSGIHYHDPISFSFRLTDKNKIMFVNKNIHVTIKKITVLFIDYVNVKEVKKFYFPFVMEATLEQNYLCEATQEELDLLSLVTKKVCQALKRQWQSVTDITTTSNTSGKSVDYKKIQDWKWIPEVQTQLDYLGTRNYHVDLNHHAPVKYRSTEDFKKIMQEKGYLYNC